MPYDIRQEAGEEFAALGRLVEEMTPKIVPHVQEVTALPLPQTVTIRVVAVQEWMRLWAFADERLLASEIEALSPTGDEIQAGRAFLLAKREAHRRMAVGAQTVTYDGYASVVVLADNLREAGHFMNGTWSTSYVRTMLGHELVHVGQDTAGGEEYRLVTHTPFPRRRRHADRRWAFAAEGHAVWAQELVTARLRADAQTPVLDHVRAVGPAGSALQQQSLKWYADTGRAVSEVIAACGLRSFNQIWTQHDLLPTAAEERDHAAWQRRLMGLPPTTNGPGDFAAGPLPGAGTRSFAVTLPHRP